MHKKIYVYENFFQDVPQKMGCLYVDLIRGEETYSFEFNNDWLSFNSSLFLSPDLYMYTGRQYPINNKQLGVFSDSCPDRWGRILMKRREAVLAKNEGRGINKLYESDYLLNVDDRSRMGALRFSLKDEGPFLSDNSYMSIPPLERLRTLEQASIAFENEDNTYNDEWVNVLIQPGSSLGGARPKANIVDANNDLWIAKFPSKKDDYNVGAWEKVANDLAQLCGLNVPKSNIKKFSKYGSTFLVKRFDRDNYHRIHFASAMTMLGKYDGISHNEASYLDIASFLKIHSANALDDLKELWKRILFNIAISNTDDHLRNHGFLLTKKGWRLSPLYDINPVPYGDTLSLDVSLNDCTKSVENALEVAEYFNLSFDVANDIVKEMLYTIKKNWRITAERYNISREEINEMQYAFRECERL